MRSLCLRNAATIVIAVGYSPIALMAETEALVFGPQVYLREAGGPQHFTEHYSLASTDGIVYLRVLNGEENGDHRLSSSTVSVNDVERVHEQDLNQQVYEIIVPMSGDLRLDNTIDIRLNSIPDGFLTIDVFATLDSIEVTPGAVDLTTFEPAQQLTVTGNFSDLAQRDLTAAATGTTYASSDPSIAEVDENGLVSAVSAGAATITATTGEHQANALVTVVLLESIEISPDSFALSIENPTQQLTVTGTMSDDSQVDLTAAETGTTYTSSDSAVAEVDAGGLVAAVADGTATITATNHGQEAAAAVEVITELKVAIEDPETGLVTAASSIDVSGTTSGAEAVTVNGVDASISDGLFTAVDVPLFEGTNVLVATAERTDQTSSDTVIVRRDTSPPLVVIETPRDGDRLVTETITVAGTVNDIIPGSTTNSDDVTVTVNGIAARVNNRTFILPDVRLGLGENTITAEAVDRVGNTNTTEIRVTREPDLAGVQIIIIEGNAQRGPINGSLPVPLSVHLQRDGNPEVGRPVDFEVSRGDGLIGDPADELRTVTLLTDANGDADVDFNLGSRTGEGFHRVRVTTPGSLTFAEFCATAEPEVPVIVSIGSMPPVRGPVGQTLPNPLTVILTDEGGNAVPDAEVTFQIDFGGGNFDGQDSVIANTNLDGIAEAFLTLGPDPGENIATADFAGNPGFPATFIVSGIVTGPVEDTSVSAVVLDNAGSPIVGVRAVIRNTNLEAFTGPNGKFTILAVPPGGHHVGVLGSTANDPANGIFFPDIDFAVEALAGVDNMLDPPVVTLPFLDNDGAKLVGGDEDVVLTMQDVPGFAIKVFANSTFTRDPDTGELVPAPDILMSSSQVKLDKLPMPPPQGSTPLIIGTLQPPGIILDPPAQVTYPNVEGLAPGDVADIFAFHHDIGQFVNIGPGTVSEDGSVVVSDPGFGIVQSGWHCLIRIPGDGAKCANDCKAKLEWRIFKADGNLGPARTKGPVELCVGQSAEITVRFQPPGGIFDSMNWSGGSPQVTRSAESASGTTAKITLQASSTTGTTTVTSPKYRITVPGKPDKTCEAAVEVKVVEFPTDVSFALSNQTGASEPNSVTAGFVTIGGKPFVRLAGISPARYAPKIKITAPDDARAREFEVGLLQNLLTGKREFDYPTGVQVRNVLSVLPIKDGVPSASGLFDQVFLRTGAPILGQFASNGDEVQLALDDVPGDGAFLSLLDNPSCGPPLLPATLEKLTVKDTFRTWLGVRHKPSGCVKTLHHIDWNPDWEATVTIVGGTATLTLVKKSIDVTVANGDGSPQFIQGAPVPADPGIVTKECN